MKNIIKFELKRAFINRSFAAALAIGLVITVSHIFTSVVPSIKYLDNYLLGKGEYPLSVFNKWIGGEGYSFQPSLFFLLLPVLCCIPYGDSLYQDRNEGYTKNLFVRAKKEYYYAAKVIAVFLSAGAAAVIPLLVNLLMTAMLIPSLMPEASAMTFPVFESGMWSSLFYTHPYIYILCYFILIFLFAGLIGLIALAVSFYVTKRFLVVIIPYVGYVLIDFICSYLLLFKYSPKIFLQPTQPASADFKIIAAEFLLLLLAAGIIYVWNGKKDEAF